MPLPLSVGLLLRAAPAVANAPVAALSTLRASLTCSPLVLRAAGAVVGEAVTVDGPPLDIPAVGALAVDAPARDGPAIDDPARRALLRLVAVAACVIE